MNYIKKFENIASMHNYMGSQNVKYPFVLATKSGDIEYSINAEHNRYCFQPGNEIWYTSVSGNIINPSDLHEIGPAWLEIPFNYIGPEIISNTYKNGKGVIKFASDITFVGLNYIDDGDNTRCEYGPVFLNAGIGTLNTDLLTISLPDTVTSINGFDEFGPFYFNTDLYNIILKNPNINIGEAAFVGTGITSFTALSNMTEIPAECFASCEKLTEVNLHNSISTIEDGAFYCCTALTQITIPNSVTSIGESVFNGCSKLTSATIGNAVTSIGAYTFKDCSSLESINIPDSVTSIGESVFNGCSKLTSATIGNAVTSIGAYAFNGCIALESINIPDSVTSINASAFRGCTALTQITIPNSVESIGALAFNGCTALTQITIPNSVESIGSSAFNGCSALTQITCEGTTPADIDSPFENTNNCPIYVPEESVQNYKTAWSGYANRIFGFAEYPSSGTINGESSFSTAGLQNYTVTYNCFYTGSISVVWNSNKAYATISNATNSGCTITISNLPSSTEDMILTGTVTCGNGSSFTMTKTITVIAAGPSVDIVDLGLSVKWAKCNLGADEESDFGHYYMWGSTEPNDNDDCDWENAPFNDGSSFYNEEYFEEIKNEVCTNGILDSEYDAVTQAYGSAYRMPTSNELNELISGTDNEWIENYNDSGHDGILFTNKSDDTKFIFVPAAGWRNGNVIGGINQYVQLWSSSLSEDYAYANCLGGQDGEGLDVNIWEYERCTGYSIRPVLNTPSKGIINGDSNFITAGSKNYTVTYNKTGCTVSVVWSTNKAYATISNATSSGCTVTINQMPSSTEDMILTGAVSYGSSLIFTMRKTITIGESLLPTNYYAWFDAIDNQNTGTHNNSATSWADKAGAYTLPLYENSFSGCQWYDTYFSNNNSSSAYGQFKNTVLNISFNLGTSDCTLIFIGNPIELLSDNGYPLGESFRSGTGYNRWAVGYSNNNTIRFNQNIEGSWEYQVSYTPASTIVNKNLIICVTRTDDTMKLYVNGVLKDTNTDYWSSLTTEEGPQAIIGARKTITYAALIYKRVLTDTEISNLTTWAADRYGISFENI